MEDSIELLVDEKDNRSPNNKPSGRVRKGFETIVATNATIPTKYQTVVISHNGKKGFLSKTKRFEEQTNENPGPGRYLSHTNFESNSTSYSAKGTGGLASNSKRSFGMFNSKHQGGSSVLLPSTFDQKQDFNRSGNTRIFHKEIAQKIEAEPTPAPNQYKVDTHPFNRPSAEAAFRSRTKREMDYLKEASRIPAPSVISIQRHQATQLVSCGNLHLEPVETSGLKITVETGQYSVNYKLVQESSKTVSCPFKSKSKRICTDKTYPFPGPGSYDLNKQMNAKIGNKKLQKHYLCLSAPALQLPPEPPCPGPGTYDIPSDFQEKPKQYMSSSAFVSTTGRWCATTNEETIPGPASYHLVLPSGKQSFLLNADGKWI